jgi:hypothetical protein
MLKRPGLLKRTGLLAALLMLFAAEVRLSAQNIGALFGSGPDLTEVVADGSEFVFARLQYGSGLINFGRGRGSGWATDWPEADSHFMLGIDRLSNIRVKLDDYISVAPGDPAIYDYPFLYAVEVGRWYLDQSEADQLREYLERGGFLVVDDFWGTYQWNDFYGQLAKVFPDREVEAVPMDHPIFHSFYDIDEILQVPNIGNARRGGPTWEGDGYTPYALAIFDDARRPMVMINYNTDLGDAWEHADDPGYPHLYSGFAYRMGINFIVYSMTH